jgi:kinesin family protein 2/24
MIGCISPCSSSADHSLNTLRYADRLKSKKNKQDEDIEEKLNKSFEDNLI